MAANPAIVELLQEVLNGSGTFKARAMFGGHGLYFDGTFFAILDDGVLYFKVSDRTRPGFEAEGMGPFTYRTKGGEQALNTYWRVPERLLDEPDDMRAWVQNAVGAARSAARQKAPKTKARGATPVRKGKAGTSKPAAKKSESAPKSSSPRPLRK